MIEYVNRGTLVHVALRDCTIINNGTIMHLEGGSNNIENRGQIMHNNGGRVIQMCDGRWQQFPEQENIVYRDKIVYQDRYVSSKKTKEYIKKLEEEVKTLKEQTEKSEEAVNRSMELEKNIAYLENTIHEQKRDIEELRTDLEATDRIKLLKKIEELEQKVRRAKNRERTCRTQQYEKGYQAGVVDGSNKKKEVFDWGVRPSREQAEAIVKQLRIWLKCEE